VSYFLVGIRGDSDRAAGLLAKAGIQNVVAKDAVVGGDIAARLSAQDAEAALERVRRALESEPFMIEYAAREQPGEA
jgi:surface antigen